MDRETEFMICMKEQGFCDTIEKQVISFPLMNIICMWDILNEERASHKNENGK